MKKITPEDIKTMPYVQLMAFLEEVNRPPGGKDSIRQIVQNCFITKESKVLDVGCNTGYCAFEMAHLIKCRVIGIDISKDMIKTANKMKGEDPLGSLIKFRAADAMNLPFPDECFDVVVCGGSTAFIEDKKKAVSEYKRVTKPWGFVADINFFYKSKPRPTLIGKLNSLMDITIQPWDITYWLNLYKQCGLEEYFIYTDDVKEVSDKEVRNYCALRAKQKRLAKESEKALKSRLIEIMSLFNENHRYLAYGVFILRKRASEEQISLFAP